MQAVLLVAGLGGRLRPRTEHCPKCMIQIDGKPLLHWSMENLVQSGVDRIVMVTGYRGDAIRQYFGAAWNSVSIEYAENPDYASSGTYWSLLQAMKLLDPGKFLLLEGDLLYHPGFIDIAVAQQQCAVLTSDVSESGDEVFVSVDMHGYLVTMGKRLDRAQWMLAPGELSGISVLDTALLDSLRDQADRERDYEQHLSRIARRWPVAVVHCPTLPWIEIDTERDYQRAVLDILPRLKGAWRAGTASDRVLTIDKSDIAAHENPKTVHF